LRFGTPEAITPVTTRYYLPAVSGMAALAKVDQPPLALSEITAQGSKRGYELRLPLPAGEMIYGLGLKFHSM
jgi:hypothetical protein